jgi:SAM-dependent methyltransferase
MNKPDPSYSKYVNDQRWAADYQQYQQRYRKTLRSSDKVIIDIIREKMTHQSYTVLDAGCSTGNLLYHLHKQLPAAQLVGVDLMKKVVEDCRQDQELNGIQFEVGDVTALDTPAPNSQPSCEAGFSIIVANAVLTLLNDEELSRAIDSIHSRLCFGGWLVAFDYVNSYDQDLTILEKDPTIHPEGVTLRFRPQSEWARLLSRFTDMEFRPFHIPIDLKVESGSLETRTILDVETGHRLLFRGSLNQPWCHIVAKKPL